MTGSWTTGTPAGRSSSAAATAAMVVASPSMPIFTASTPRSSATAATCARMTSAGTGEIARTSTVFCAVIAVMAVVPWTPAAANALRSAWIPAPPPESEPAMDSTTGIEREAGTPPIIGAPAPGPPCGRTAPTGLAGRVRGAPGE